MKNKIATFLCLTLLTIVAACPAASQSEPDTRRVAMFGKVLKLLSGRHPYLDLTQRSAMQSFHFTIGGAEKQAIQGPSSAFHRFFIEAHVVRDRNTRAVILHFGEGYAYYASDGIHSFLAMVTPMDADHVLATKSGGISVGGFVTKQQATVLKLPGSDMFGVTMSRNPPIFLRVFGLIHARMLIARKIEFQALPRPLLFVKWIDDQNAVSTLRVSFNLGRNHLFPVRRFTMTQLKRGIISTAWISGIGEGVAPGEPFIHRIKDIEDRAELPWKNVSVMMLFHRFLNYMHYLTNTPPTSAEYLLLRRRFVNWAVTPDTALTTAHADTGPAPNGPNPRP